MEAADGTFSDEDECKASDLCQGAPPGSKWKCTAPATGMCHLAADGTFDAEEDCKASTDCKITSIMTRRRIFARLLDAKEHGLIV